MKVVIQQKQNFVLRFDSGEEVFFVLAKFLKDQNINACGFTGIGASGEVELGYFEVEPKNYIKKVFLEDLEILSFSGNGSLKNGEPFVHAHGMFGRKDFTTIGGHVFKLLVSVTCEIFLSALEGELKRELDPESNLRLLA